MEDTTQETPVETPVEDKVEAEETKGVEQETPDAQEEETKVEKEVKADKEAEESLFKTLMEKKGFKSEEDLAKAYSELEVSNTKKSQDNKELDKLLDALLEEDDSKVDEIDKAEAKPSGKTEKLEADVNLMKLQQKHPDVSEYADSMKKIAEKNKDAKGMFRTADGVELLYKMAKVERQEQMVEEAKEQGRTEVTEKELDKAQAQVASNTKAKQSFAPKFTRESVEKMSGDEYDANRDEIMALMAEGKLE